MKTSQIVTETTETAGHILWILRLRLYDFSPAWKGIIFSASKTVLSPVLEWIAIGYDDPPRTRQCQMVKLTILRDLSKAEFWPLLCPPWSGWDRLRGMESDIPKCTGEATAFLSNQLPASQCLFWGFPCLQCLPSQVCTDFNIATENLSTSSVFQGPVRGEETVKVTTRFLSHILQMIHIFFYNENVFPC